MEAPPSTRRAYYDFSSMDILIDDTRVDYFASLGLHMALGVNVRFEGQRNRLGRILAARVRIDDVAHDMEPGLLAKILRERPEFMAIDERDTEWIASPGGVVRSGSAFGSMRPDASVPDEPVVPEPRVPRRAATEPRPRPATRIPEPEPSGEAIDHAVLLMEALKSARLATYAKAFSNAGIDSLEYLKEHSIGQLQESFTRPHVGLKKSFVFSAMERKGLVAIGLIDDLSPPLLGSELLPFEARLEIERSETAARAAEAAAAALEETTRVRTAADAEAIRRTAAAKAAADVTVSASRGGLAGLVEAGAAWEAAMAVPDTPIARGASGHSAPARPLPGVSADTWDLADLPLCGSLFSGVSPSDITVEMVNAINKALTACLKSGSDSPKEVYSGSTDLDEAIDFLEAFLQVGVTQKRWTISELTPNGAPSVRLSKRHMVTLALTKAIAPPSTMVSVPPTGDTPGSDVANPTMMAMAGAILDASKGSMSEKDLKIADELGTSEARLNAVCADPSTRAKLAQLETVIQSTATADEKIQAWDKLVLADSKAKELLFSIYVRAPSGTSSLSNPHAHDVFRMFRVCQNGFKAAAARKLELVMPHDADPELLVECTFKGELGVTNDKFNLKAIIEPKAKGNTALLGSGSQGTTSTAKVTEENLVILMGKAMNVLSYAIRLIHCGDATSAEAITSVMASIYLGLERNGVANAVERILSPLFRSVEKSWKLFQASKAVAFPDLEKLWNEEKVKPHVALYLTISALPSLDIGVSSTSAGAAKVEPKEKISKADKEAKTAENKAKQAKATELAKTKKDLATANAKLLEMSDADDEGDGQPVSSAAKKRAKAKDAIAKKDAFIEKLQAEIAAAK